VTRGEIDIARNFKTIEWLKSELVGGVANLFKAMMQNGEDAILDALVNLFVVGYLLGRRLGISFERIDTRLESKVKANMDAEHEIERWYGDFSALYYHILDRGKKK
jgi:hypothetical protein